MRNWSSHFEREEKGLEKTNCEGAGRRYEYFPRHQVSFLSSAPFFVFQEETSLCPIDRPSFPRAPQCSQWKGNQDRWLRAGGVWFGILTPWLSAVRLWVSRGGSTPAKDIASVWPFSTVTVTTTTIPQPSLSSGNFSFPLPFGTGNSNNSLLWFVFGGFCIWHRFPLSLPTALHAVPLLNSPRNPH